MDYLFFDTECADGNRLCSFGYVLTDKNFNVTEKRDILINPECSFRLGRGDEQWIKLSYGEEEFYGAPAFGKLYGQIQQLLCAPQRVLLGHGISSDLGFLERAASRYRKPPFDLTVFDTQIIYSLVYGDVTRGLDYIVDAVGANRETLTEHKSCDDAEMSMLCAKAAAAKLNCDLDGLIKKHSAAAVKSDSLVLGRAIKEVKRRYPKMKKAEQICISDSIPYRSPEGRINLIFLLAYRGYGYTNTVSKAKYYVTDGGDGIKQRAYAACENKPAAITAAQLGALLNAQVNEFCETYDKFPTSAALTVREIFNEAIENKPRKKTAAARKR